MKLTENVYFYPEKGMLDCNTYVIRGESTIVIDPGFTQKLPALLKELRDDGIDPGHIDIITNTHLHIDHCWGNQGLKEASGAKVLTHPLQQKFYSVSVVETSRFFGLDPVELKEGGPLDSLADVEFIPAPGHSPDSICFYFKKDRALVCGDVIFSGNTGRVDLPGGSSAQLKQSIEELSRLEIEYLLPGHMEIVAGADRVKGNFEFVRRHVFPWL